MTNSYASKQLLLLSILLAAFAGCGQIHFPGEKRVVPATKSAKAGAATEFGNRWDVIRMQGQKVGYGETNVRSVKNDGRELVEIRYYSKLVVKRVGRRVELSSGFTSLETPAGNLVRFESETALSGQPMRSVGRVQDGKLHLDQTTAGKTTSRSIPWSDEIRGPYAVNQSLRQSPLQPDQTRTLRQWEPTLNQVVTVQLSAAKREQTPMLSGTQELLRISAVSSLTSGTQLPEMIVWTNRKGDVLKSAAAGGGPEVFKTDEATALADAGLLDIGLSTVVKIAQPLPRGHATPRARYRVKLKRGDPAKEFANGEGQRVRSLDAHTAEIIVRSVRPSTPASNFRSSPPTKEDSQPNGMIQSDDARIVAMANSVAAGERDPWKVATGLEQYVHKAIRSKNFSVALATAAEVAQSLEGDCTEHAVLLAALARARGIPARVAIGLVYRPAAQDFAFHMWNEVYVQDKWIPLDATLGQAGIGAGHLKLADANLRDEDRLTSFLPVVQVMNQLQLELLDAGS